jgi:hypothetical protein
MNKTEICKPCLGIGADGDGEPCKACDGTGAVVASHTVSVTDAMLKAAKAAYRQKYPTLDAQLRAVIVAALEDAPPVRNLYTIRSRIEVLLADLRRMTA